MKQLKFKYYNNRVNCFDDDQDDENSTKKSYRYFLTFDVIIFHKDFQGVVKMRYFHGKLHHDDYYDYSPKNIPS